MSRTIVIGGGAAGMMAAWAAASHGAQTVLLEKNEKLGKKIYITGKGRCNLTNYSYGEDFLQNVVSNRKFMYSSFYGFDTYMTIDTFNSFGLETKIERGNRVFPLSDHASDVTAALKRALDSVHAEIVLSADVSAIECDDSGFKAVVLSDGRTYAGDSCIVATGGLSYPSTGSDGDGYAFAKKLGHKVTRLLPSLVSLKVKESFVKRLEGLSLRNVSLTMRSGGKQYYNAMGEMLFTHDGISGPLVLTLSSMCGEILSSGKECELSIDLKPALDTATLDRRILSDFEVNINRKFSNALDKLLPSKLIPVVIEQCGIDPEKRINEITKAQRERLVDVLKNFRLSFERLGGYNEAVVTKGGVDVSQINPSTMESKLIRGLYFAGEVLDLDALTGGYNLQIAWSTGYAAGVGAASQHT